MVQLLYGAVFYEGIGYTDTSEMGNIVIVRHELQYGTAHPSFFDTVFYGDDMLEVESHLVQQGFVERLEKTQVVVGYGDSFVLLRTLYGTCGHVAYGTEGDDCQVFAAARKVSITDKIIRKLVWLNILCFILCSYPVSHTPDSLYQISGISKFLAKGSHMHGFPAC